MTNLWKNLNMNHKKDTIPPFLKWLFIVIFVWGIPSIILWGSIKLSIGFNLTKKTNQKLEDLAIRLENQAYLSNPERFFQPYFVRFFSQLSSLPVDTPALGRITEELKNQWPAGMLDVYLFDKDYSLVIGADKSTKEVYETFIKLVNETYEIGSADKNTMEIIGKAFPSPEFTVARLREQRGKVIDLGSADRFSHIYFDFAQTATTKYVAGILIVVHKQHIDMTYLARESIALEDKQNIGFINKDGESFLPNLIADVSPKELFDYALHFPTNKFERFGKLIALKTLDEDRILVGATNKPAFSIQLIAGIFLIYLLISFFALKLSFETLILDKRLRYDIKTRLIGLFAICYTLPLFVAALLAVQYLSEFTHSTLTDQIQSNYRRLAEIDFGFSRFLTSRLTDLRNFTETLRQNVTDENKIIDLLDNKYKTFKSDSLHVIASDARLVYSNDLMTVEMRRHYKKSDEEKHKILESWRLRYAPLNDKHLKALFSEGDKDGNPEYPEPSLSHDAFIPILVSFSLSAMDSFNSSHGKIKVTKKTPSNLIVDTMIESKTQSLLQVAQTNISRFTTITGINEVFTGYLDVIQGPAGEAWYSILILNDLINFQRQYFDALFSENKNPSNTLNLINLHEDIRALSTHHYAVNYPSIMEFTKFESTIRRSETDFKTFTQKMRIDNQECLVSTLKGSYLNHYLLLKITPLAELTAQYYKHMRLILLCFAILILIGFILLRMLALLFIQPIDEIMEGIQSMAQKNFTHRIPIRSENEFGVLAQAFNESASVLGNLSISERIQKEIYPENEYRCGSYLISTANSSSRIILSDFFDYVRLKQGTYAIMLAEVTGNDISAAYITSMLKAAFILLCPSFPNNPEVILKKLNNYFLPYYHKGHMTTCIIGILDPTNDKITLANAGQSYPIYINTKTRTKSFLSLPSTPLGLSVNARFACKEISLEEHSLIFYSDGAINLPDKMGVPVGHDNLMKLLDKSLASDPRNISKELINNLNNISTNFPWRDDITVMTIQNRI